MPRITYVNGRYLPHDRAAVHVEDRGYQFADGVYEVCEVRAGALIDEQGHLDRLERSLSAVQIAPPVAREALRFILREIMRRNLVRDGYVYVQVTRGVAPRDHAFPKSNIRASLVVSARSLDRSLLEARASVGVRVVTLPDERWARPDIKSVSLLPNVLAKQAAKERGAQEAWLVDRDGLVTEGAASNAWIVLSDGTIVTRQIDRSILRGVTRTSLLDVIARLGLRLQERAFSVEEAHSAAEAFLTGATALVTPVIAIDDRAVGNGIPGPVVLKLRRELIK
jgi:D-alanine transaminase